MLKNNNSKSSFLLPLFLFAWLSHASGQSEFQGWLNLILGYNPINQLYLEGNFEYQRLLSDSQDPWRNFSFSLMGEYYPTRLLDLSIEIINGKTHQSSELVSDEASQRFGTRLYILQRGHNLFRLSAGSDGAPQRIEFSNYIRFEHRSFDYFNDLEPDNSWRIRDRTQFVIALNKKTFNENRMIRFLADFEFFIPIGKEITERHASNFRVRMGPGYRHNYHWRFTLLYLYDKSRNNIDEQFKISSHMINLQMSYIF